MFTHINDVGGVMQGWGRAGLVGHAGVGWAVVGWVKVGWGGPCGQRHWGGLPFGGYAAIRLFFLVQLNMRSKLVNLSNYAAPSVFDHWERK